MPDNEVRRAVLRIAAELPPSRADALKAIGMVEDLIDWIYPAEPMSEGELEASARCMDCARDNGSDERSPR